MGPLNEGSPRSNDKYSESKPANPLSKKNTYSRIRSAGSAETRALLRQSKMELRPNHDVFSLGFGQKGGFRNLGLPFWGPNSKDYRIWGSILGSPLFMDITNCTQDSVYREIAPLL